MNEHFRACKRRFLRCGLGRFRLGFEGRLEFDCGSYGRWPGSCPDGLSKPWRMGSGDDARRDPLRFGRHVENIWGSDLLPGGGTFGPPDDAFRPYYARRVSLSAAAHEEECGDCADCVRVALRCTAEQKGFTSQIKRWILACALIARANRQKAIQRMGPLNRSFSQSSTGGRTRPGVRKYLAPLQAHNARPALLSKALQPCCAIRASTLGR